LIAQFHNRFRPLLPKTGRARPIRERNQLRLGRALLARQAGDLLIDRLPRRRVAFRIALLPSIF
jgi:hypothetical protein